MLYIISLQSVTEVCSSKALVSTKYGEFQLKNSNNFSLPPPLCNSYALVIATVGGGTVLIWYPVLIRYQM